MTPFPRVRSIAAPLLEDNVDTDVIFPARFLLLLDKAGLGRHAFHDHRFTPEGAERAAFVLNRAPYRDTQILLAGANFGSGSSREQAVWCLQDFGIHCVIAPSFGDIFSANCLNNGVLPIVLPKETIAQLASDTAPLEVDLVAQHVVSAAAGTIAFAIKPDAREALLQGWDVTQRILQSQAPAIAAFEARHRAAQSWLF